MPSVKSMRSNIAALQLVAKWWVGMKDAPTSIPIDDIRKEAMSWVLELSFQIFTRVNGL